MKRIFYAVLLIEIILFVLAANIFFKTHADFNHVISINIIFAINFIIILVCKIVIDKIFKKTNLDNSKSFRRDLKNTFASAFFSSSLISIILACLVYGLLEKTLELFNIKTGIINYCSFIAKIWFISSPFIGLEIVVFKYFSTIKYFQKPLKILIMKLFVFLFISCLFYTSRKANCFIYAKPICDILFLFYYSRICFDITLNKS